MLSFDVESLFTNVPLNFTINLILSIQFSSICLTTSGCQPKQTVVLTQRQIVATASWLRS